MSKNSQYVNALRMLHERDHERVMAALRAIYAASEYEIHRTDGAMVRAIGVSRAELLDALQASRREQGEAGRPRGILTVAAFLFEPTTPDTVTVTESQDDVRDVLAQTDQVMRETIADWLDFRGYHDAADALRGGAPYNEEDWKADRQERFKASYLASLEEPR